jgi:16S rRNA C1402 (ribose-2'-O) methylase RsmI
MGFIPHKGNQRQKVLGQIASSLLPVVVYEAPHRVLQTLEDLGKVLTSDRPVLVARELTKLHEQLLHVRLSEAIEHFRAAPPKGEFTFVIAPESGAADGGGGTAAAGDSVGKMTAVEKQACALLQVHPASPTPRPSPPTPRPSPPTPRPSPPTPRPSLLVPHPSPLTSHPSPFTPHPYRSC